MARWFRFYDNVVNDPKVQRLPGEKFKAWVNLLCLASANDGVLPPIDDLCYTLRFSQDKMSGILNDLCAAGLLDPVEVEGAPMSYTPHNWKGRQFKSDVSTERVKRFRNAQRNANETFQQRPSDVTETPPDTDTDTESDIGASPPGKVYAFIGRTIRLEKKHLEKWRKTYHAIPDFMAALQAADDYYTENPPKGGKWFFPVSRWLEKQHTAHIQQKRAGDAW